MNVIVLAKNKKTGKFTGGVAHIALNAATWQTDGYALLPNSQKVIPSDVLRIFPATEANLKALEAGAFEKITQTEVTSGTE